MRPRIITACAMKSLGGDRYQVGTIVVDKRARRFSVPGRVHLLGKPLEYLATAPGGMKAYETLFEEKLDVFMKLIAGQPVTFEVQLIGVL